LSETEKAAWNALKSVCTNFLGNHIAENYREIVSEIFKFFQVMKCNTSLKLYFLDYHLYFFPQNLGEVSDEYGERIDQDIFIMEKQFLRRWNCSMLEECCCL
jgi:hypothetical protein